MNENPRFKELVGFLKSAGVRVVHEWSGPVYRCVEPSWARPEYLVDGEGTKRYGGRWMMPGVARVVHASSTELIALKESRRAFAYYGISKPRKKPRVSVEIYAELSRVVDLVRLEDETGFPTIDELLNEDWQKVIHGGQESLAQAVGRAVWAVGHEGLLTPSARDRRGRNLVWFPGNLLPGSEIAISGKTDLERWIAK